MRFEDFAALHGLDLDDHVIQYGKWVRTRTIDKPRDHRNGAYKHLGEVAFVQNWGTMAEVAIWFPDAEAKPLSFRDKEQLRARQARAERQLAEDRARAAAKADSILKQCRPDLHPYLALKGFPSHTAPVWRPDADTCLLVLPMKIGSILTGCQLIDAHGNKTFIAGQQSGRAEFLIGRHKPFGVIDIWVEGYATALSAREALNSLKKRHCIHVCFSAGNMRLLATQAGTGFVIADNDASGTGEKAARATGLPYFLPPSVDQDLNDFALAVGRHRAAQALRAALVAHEQTRIAL